MRALLILFLLIPLALMAQEGDTPFADGMYQMTIGVSGQAAPGGEAGSAKTEQLINGMSYPAYTVAYTAVVDAIREILTMVWALENADGLTDAKVKELIADPGALYKQ